MENKIEITLKFYGIEVSERDYYGAQKYRFYSRYNGTRGAWHITKLAAELEGEKHEQLVKLIHRID